MNDTAASIFYITFLQAWQRCPSLQCKQLVAMTLVCFHWLSYPRYWDLVDWTLVSHLQPRHEMSISCCRVCCPHEVLSSYRWQSQLVFRICWHLPSGGEIITNFPPAFLKILPLWQLLSRIVIFSPILLRVSGCKKNKNLKLNKWWWVLKLVSFSGHGNAFS